VLLGIDFGNSTEMALKVPSVPRAKCYEVRTAVVNSNNNIGHWQPAGLFTSTKLLKFKDLTPGTTYAFQVRAIGGSSGYSDWSNPVSRMCV
jgi:hypothetical protein